MFFAAAAALIFTISSFGQEPAKTPQPDPAAKEQRRPGLMRALGLTSEQMALLNQIENERRPLMAEAQRNLRQANRALDQAIYAETADETEVQARLKDLQNAQAEIARLRVENELAIRRILTPEQMVQFRQMRMKFAEGMKERRQEERRVRPARRRAPGSGLSSPEN